MQEAEVTLRPIDRRRPPARRNLNRGILGSSAKKQLSRPRQKKSYVWTRYRFDDFHDISRIAFEHFHRPNDKFRPFGRDRICDEHHVGAMKCRLRVDRHTDACLGWSGEHYKN
jgi:hypothetical protein